MLDFKRHHSHLQQSKINKHLSFFLRESLLGQLLLTLMICLTLNACDHRQASTSFQSATWSAADFLETEYNGDSSVFTQCLAWEAPNVIWQSSGSSEQSALFKLMIRENSLILENSWPIPDIFAEGCTPWGGFILLLSWRSFTIHVFDKASAQQVGVWPIATEGWGLSGSPQGLIYSDGSSVLRWISSPSTWNRESDSALEVHKEISIYDGQTPVFQLNELEWVEEFIFANVYPQDRVALIDSQSGQVLAWLNLTPLFEQSSGTLAVNHELTQGVANGIAYDQRQKLIWFTGKNWTKIYGLKATSLLSGLRLLKEKSNRTMPTSSR